MTKRLAFTRYYLASVDSTNDLAKEVGGRLPEPAMFVTYHQTRGRGTGDRVWHGNPGQSLAISYCLHHPSRVLHETVTLRVALAVRGMLQHFGIDAGIKPPNDVMVGPLKIAGILCETQVLSDTLELLVIGIGLNVAQEVQDLDPGIRDIATSMKLAGATDLDLLTIESTLTQCLIDVLDADPSDLKQALDELQHKE